MAKITRTVTELTDDIDGGEAIETISFALDGTSYDIDLNEGNAAALRDAFSTYVGHARKASSGGARRGSRRTPAASSSGNTAEIRAWAKDQGLTVSERGRISAEVVAAYEAAH